MKTATIPFPREFSPGDSGIDCRAVKGGLARALGVTYGMSLKTRAFGPVAGKALSHFKLMAGLIGDPIYTLEAHEKLRIHFTEQQAGWMVKAYMSISAQRQRDAYVSAWLWAIAHDGENEYDEIRPIPYWLAPFETTTIIRTDCSGETGLLAKWEGLSDPSKLGFDGAGNTGTLLAACTKVTAAQALPADLIVYRKGSWDTYGHHVVAILKRLSATDFEVGSNGHQGDPGQYTHSQMLAGQASAGYPDAVFLRWLPVP